MSKKFYSHNALGFKCNVVSHEEILKEICPTASLSSEVEEELSSIINDTIQAVVKGSCKFAEHRSSSSVEPEDIALFLKTQCNLDPSLLSDDYYYAGGSIGKPTSLRASRKSQRIIDKVDTTLENCPDDPFLCKISKFKEKIIPDS